MSETYIIKEGGEGTPLYAGNGAKSRTVFLNLLDANNHIGELEQENATLRQQLAAKTEECAAYEAEPVVGVINEGTKELEVCDAYEDIDGTWLNGVLYSALIRKPTSTEHVDAVKAQARCEGMEQLLPVLIKVQEDINWMCNSEQLLNRFVFNYLDEAIRAAMKGEQHE